MWLVSYGGVVVWKVTPGLLLPGVEKHAEQRFLNKAGTVMMQHAEILSLNHNIVSSVGLS